MSLILRTELSRPLTHQELDENFKFVYLKEWEYGDYKVKQLVYKKEGDITTIYRCVYSHNRYAYDPSHTFNTSVVVNGNTHVAWEAISNTGGGSSNDERLVNAYYNDGVLKFLKQDGTYKNLDLSELAEDFYVISGAVTGNNLRLNLQDGRFVDIDVSSLSEGIESVELDGTTMTFTQQDGSVLTTDLNLLYLVGTQFKKGITTHDFFTMSEIHFTSSSFPLAFPTAVSPPAENIQYKSLTFADFPAKETTIVLSISSNISRHYIFKLPEKTETGSINHLGKRIRVFMKRNSLSDVTKSVMLATSWQNSGNDNRLLSLSANTTVTGLGYFLPLETMEVVDLFWDGDDWIALTTNKQEYSLLAANNFTVDVSTYINRT